MWKKQTRLTLIIVLMAVGMVGRAMGGTIYVDAGAIGNNDGSSWADAYLSLHDALTGAAGGDIIWVAEGTYTPDPIGLADPREATFQLASGVAIYGGFPSGGGTWSDRNPTAHETILSGDLNADDVQVDLRDLQNEPTRGENSFHVVTVSNTDNAPILDGFSIIEGNANDGEDWNSGSEYAKGGGIYIYYSSPILSNCTFSGNSALRAGGAIHCYYSSLVITNCTFTGNSATGFGGAMRCRSSSHPTINNCTFNGNFAGYGGGIYAGGDCNPIIINCEINGNYSWHGVLYLGQAQVINCIISGNSAMSGSAVSCRGGSAPLITNTIFEGNTGSQAIYESDPEDDPVVTYCLFHNNPNGDYYDHDTTSSYTGAEAINTNVAEASNNIDGDPMFVEAGYWDGSTWIDGDYHLLLGSPCIDAGDNTVVPPDTLDLDNDSDITEPVPIDLDGNPRFDDCPDISDTGNGMPPIVDIGAYEVIAPVTQVAIDIKPGSYPNAINLGSYGLIPVGILSSEDFDATTVDPETVELAGAGVAVRGKSNKYMAHDEDVNGDGLVDLLVQVATENLIPDSLQDGFAILTGNLFEEFGSTAIEGQDEITIVPPE